MKKKCPICEKTFYRNQRHKDCEWERKIFCSESCQKEDYNRRRRVSRAEHDKKRDWKKDYKKRRENGLNRPFGWTTRYLDPYLRMPLR